MKSAYDAYIRLSLRLHILDGQGRLESEEAEALRDQMDPLWYAMSQQERDLSGAFSEQIYQAQEVAASTNYHSSISAEPSINWAAMAMAMNHLLPNATRSELTAANDNAYAVAL